jgi:hypothetical protein
MLARGPRVTSRAAAAYGRRARVAVGPDTLGWIVLLADAMLLDSALLGVDLTAFQ